VQHYNLLSVMYQMICCGLLICQLHTVNMVV